jgi:hypothetical protein
LVTHGVDNSQERRTHNPNRDPAIFTVIVLVVKLLDSIGIQEHASSHLEAYAMFALVRQVLVRIPRESQSQRTVGVATLL